MHRNHPKSFLSFGFGFIIIGSLSIDLGKLLHE